jgi:hypothetical protein
MDRFFAISGNSIASRDDQPIHWRRDHGAVRRSITHETTLSAASYAALHFIRADAMRTKVRLSTAFSVGWA